MPRADILIESPIQTSFRVEQVRGMFDVPHAGSVKHEWTVDLPLETAPWQIGLIVGPSGSGKTTIGKKLFPDALFHTGYAWPDTASIVDGFPAHLDGREITQALSSVGFSSPPHWLKRYTHLSNGQKFRCELARLMLEDSACVVFDEFTSVVDRPAAKVSSAAVAKALRKRGSPQLVALSCHYDVIDWLDPDWVYDVSTGQFSRRLLRRRPPIALEIFEAKHPAWKLFSGHHYLSRTINRSASCFVACWEDVPVAFTSSIHFVHSIVQNARREHRTVVLPDFQGVGIGNVLSEWAARYWTDRGKRFLSTTSHPAMIRHRASNPLWRMSRFGHTSPVGKTSTINRAGLNASSSRLTASFEFVGGASAAPGKDSSSPCTESARSLADSPAPSTTAPSPTSPLTLPQAVRSPARPRRRSKLPAPARPASPRSIHTQPLRSAAKHE